MSAMESWGPWPPLAGWTIAWATGSREMACSSTATGAFSLSSSSLSAVAAAENLLSASCFVSCFFSSSCSGFSSPKMSSFWPDERMSWLLVDSTIAATVGIGWATVAAASPPTNKGLKYSLYYIPRKNSDHVKSILNGIRCAVCTQL